MRPIWLSFLGRFDLGHIKNVVLKQIIFCIFQTDIRINHDQDIVQERTEHTTQVYIL